MEKRQVLTQCHGLNACWIYKGDKYYIKGDLVACSPECAAELDQIEKQGKKV